MYFEDCCPWVVAAVAGGLVVLVIWGKRGKSKKIQHPRDTVILYQLPRGPAAPSLSPFPLKLETFLRMAKIPHQSVLGSKMSAKGKTPWMEYNGEAVSDSQFCIEFLKKRLNINLNSHLSPQEQAIARAFQKMTEENFYWGLVSDRWVYDQRFIRQLVSWYFVWLVEYMAKKSLWGHGMGRHTREEVYSITYGDMKALSDFLGEKKFLFGDQPCEQDCALFGMLAQIHWHSCNSVLEKTMTEKYPNLGSYCERMKTTFWPDWNEYITDWGKRKPEK